MPDVIDSRDLLAELRDLLEDSFYDYDNDPADAHREEGYEDLAGVWDALTPEDRERVQAIRGLLDELPESTVDSATGNSWGSTLIHENYFEQHARELADDIGAIDRNATWPTQYIDWSAAADALKVDYSEIEWEGETYYVR
jgi:antirestriction protein